MLCVIAVVIAFALGLITIPCWAVLWLERAFTRIRFK